MARSCANGFLSCRRLRPAACCAGFTGRTRDKSGSSAGGVAKASGRMRVGTKSVLFGAHCFVLHPWFVARAWWKLYGFPWDPRLWVAFFVHDLGYLGKLNMDGPEGELHPIMGAKIMGSMFDRSNPVRRSKLKRRRDLGLTTDLVAGEWHDFCLFHSRFLAKQVGAPFSRLCVADKLSIALTPAWLYLPMAHATGEISEYMKLAKSSDGKYVTMNISTESQCAWYADVQSYLRRWVEEHKDGRDDTWTPSGRVANGNTGVWQ